MALYLDNDGKTIRQHKPHAEIEPLGLHAIVKTTTQDPCAGIRGVRIDHTRWVRNGFGYYHPVANALSVGLTLEELVEAADTVTIIWAGETRD